MLQLVIAVATEWRIPVIRTHVSILLTVFIASASLVFPRATAAQEKSDIANIRAKVQTLSAKVDQQVEIKFRDQTKAKGQITAVEPVSFTLRDAKNGTSQTIVYSEVDSVTKAGSGMSTKTWLIIG